MTEHETWIGIDVATGWLDVAAAGTGRPWRVDNTEAGIAALVAQVIRASPAGQATETVLRAIPGVGPVGARPRLAARPALGTLSRQEAAALVGVAARTRDSGRTQCPRGLGGGRGGARTALSMAALTAVRCDPAMPAGDERVVGHGNPATVARVACLRKRLIGANAVLRDGMAWHPQGGAVA